MPISKGNRPIDTSRLTKITKVRAADPGRILPPLGTGVGSQPTLS